MTFCEKSCARTAPTAVSSNMPAKASTEKKRVVSFIATPDELKPRPHSVLEGLPQCFAQDAQSYV